MLYQGIRRNGLSVFYFWSVVVPIALFGCEVLVLIDKSEFRIYDGKTIQR